MEDAGISAAPSFSQPQPELLSPSLPSAGEPPSNTVVQPSVQVDGAPPPIPNVGAQTPKGPIPVIKEKREYQLEYPSNSAFNPFGGNGSALKKQRGVHTSNKTTAEWLNLAAKSKERDCFSVEIIRRMPPIAEDGTRLKQGRVIFSIQNLLPFSDIYNTIDLLHGGGNYSLSILNRDHETVAGCSFTIDGPTKVTEQDGGVEGYAGLRGSRFGNPVPRGGLFAQRRDYTGLSAPEDADIAKAHKMERLAMAQASVYSADAKRLEAEDRFFEVANKRKLTEVEKAKAVEEAKLKKEEMKFDAEQKKEEREATTTKELILAMLAKMGQQNNAPDMSPFMESIRLVIEQNSAAQKQQMETMLAILKSNKENDGKNGKEVQIMENMMTKFMDVAIGNAGSANQKYDKLMETLFMKKIESGDEISKINQYLDLFRKIQGPGSEEDWINPEAGFWANAGNAVLSLLKNVIQGAAAGGGGGAILELLNKTLQKPQGNTQFSDSELAPLAQALSKQKGGVQGTFQLPQPNAAESGEAEYQAGFADTELPSFVQPVAAVPANHAPVARGEAFEASMMVDDPVSANAVQQPVEQINDSAVSGSPIQLPQTGFVVESADLPLYVNMVMEEMIEDLKAARAEHTWPEMALGKWDAAFLNKLAQAPDESRRLQIIQEKADPELFARFQAELLKGDWQAYKYFLAALQTVVEEARRRSSNG